MPGAERGKRSKALFILDCGNTAPSAMVRAIQYRELLERRNDISVIFVSHKLPVLGALEQALLRLGVRYLKPLRALAALAALYRERGILRMAKSCDIVYMVKVPSLRLYRKLAALKGPRIYMDLNDGLWLPFHRSAGWEDLDRMLPLADAVICENRFVADYARRFKEKVFIIPDPPQVEAFDRWRGTVKRKEDQVILGWIGSPSSCDALMSVWEPLERLFAKHPHIHLRIVGGHPSRLPRFEKVRYSLRASYNQDEMAQEVLAMDIGLFPLFAVEDALVRGTLKAMVYMSGEAVAAARDVGGNRELIQDGVNGILAETPEDWFTKLDRLIEDGEERRRIAAAGLQTIRTHFTREKILEDLLEAFQDASSG